MGRQKLIINGEHAAEKIDIALTPSMIRFLDAIALIHNTTRTDVARNVILDFIARYRETQGTNPIIEQIEAETADHEIERLKALKR